MVLSTAAAGHAGPLLTDDPSFAPMATDENPSFGLIAADLEFILEQIQISEAHAHALATGNDAYSLLCASRYDRSGKCVRDPMLPHGLRTVDGSFNNLEFDTSTGKSNELMPRLLPIRWRDAEPVPPGAPGRPGPTSYGQTAGLVYDTSPRVISNLIVDNSVNNPVVPDSAANNDGALVDENGELYLPTLTADEGLSAPVNMWFVMFGQFFDHGLDLVDKSPADAVIVPLRPDDPLYERTPENQRWLAMSRATNQPGPDGKLGTADDVREHENRTTPWVDQNQTYTSHPAHQVFLREYELVDGLPQDTGRLLNGDNGGLATWNDVKEQARTVLGIDLRDLSVLNVPQVGVDLYGNFAPGPNGFPQLITADGAIEGNLGEPVDSTLAVPLSQSFLDDIAHGSTPLPSTDPDAPAGYDNVTLGEHFITGDGRGNENIGLTAVHHVFHSEHNRLVDHINGVLDANPNLKDRYVDNAEDDDWSYAQRVFQAARFTNEMQYQHLVFEEFARTVAPTIDVIVFNENSYDSTIDASIIAEFAHVVYRFGHSMLTEDILREGQPGVESVQLLDGFLNPNAFHCAVRTDAENNCAPGMELTPDQAAGAIVNGTTSQVANQIDELVTSTLRNNLLGLPLDLATINIARGRDTGVPGLNQARRTFFEQTGNPALEPYSSWRDFGLSLKNGENFGRGEGTASLVNFIAAYGTHPSVTEAETLSDKRAAAQALVDGVDTVDRAQRLAGSNRYFTAAEVSRANFATADTVYVANGRDFPDALAGGPAASIAGAPVLLVQPNGLPDPTAAELRRLQPKRIVVLGGPGAVSDALYRTLATHAPQIKRVAGTDRYDTAAQVANGSFPTADTVYVASGAAYPDALSGSAAAAANGSPLLLVKPTSVPPQTAAELNRLKPKNVVILGGEGAVSKTVADQLAKTAKVQRLGGSDRYGTSEAVSKHFAADGGQAYLATGRDFPDALAAASAAGAQHAPILLTRPHELSLPAQKELQRLNPNRVNALGGPVAIQDAVVTAVEAMFPTAEAPADRDAFMRSTGDWANAAGGVSTTGLEDVDFWVGGLAEALDPFGGMLGSSFNHVFEQQLEDLQMGDRFYYLFRNQGNQLFAALEANSFASLIQRNTDADVLPADIFSVPDVTIDLETMDAPPAGLNLMADGTWRWDGDEHVQIHGLREAGDKIRGGQGDDALWGYGGDDRIEGGSGNDQILGGPGNDIMTDAFGDDNIKGGEGHDAIDGGPGIDLLLGQGGQDFVTKSADNSDGATAFLGTGNDIFLGGTGRDTPFGNEGDDWLEGGAHSDLLIGDNSEQFQDDVDGGDDVLIGGANSDDMDAEGGDDIMVGSPGGTDRYHGMLGFDYVTYDGTSSGVDADLNFNVLQPPDVTTVRDRYLQVEALSGGQGDDVLRGQGIDNPDTINDDEELDMLDPENLDLIDGMRELLQPGGHLQDYSMRFRSDNAQRPDNRGVSNLILGGAGSDLIEGRFSDDFIDGDAALKVWLEVNGQRYRSAAQLKNLVFSGQVNPGDIEIVREIVDEGQAGDVDTAFYADPYGNPLIGALNYEVTELGDGYWQVRHTGALRADRSEGADVLRNIDRLQFGDGSCIELIPGEDELERTTCPAVGEVTFSLDEFTAPAEDEPLTATVAFRDEDGSTTVANPKAVKFNWQVGLEDGTWVPSALEGGPVRKADGAWHQEFTPGDGEAGNTLRVIVTFRDDAGLLRQITSPMVGDGLIVLNVNDEPTGLTLSTTAPQVGQAVLASGIADGDGMTEAMEETGITYSWQTSRSGGPFVEVASRSTLTTNQLGYRVQPEDLGARLRVVVSYTDDHGTSEDYASPPTEAVVAAEVTGP